MKKEKQEDKNRFAYGSDLGLNVVSKGKDIQKSQQNELKGGEADNKSVKDIAESHNVTVDKIKEQLRMGIKVEMEHTNDPKIALEIAMDHMTESPEYYTKLADMESSFDKHK